MIDGREDKEPAKPALNSESLKDRLNDILAYQYADARAKTGDPYWYHDGHNIGQDVMNGTRLAESAINSCPVGGNTPALFLQAAIDRIEAALDRYREHYVDPDGYGAGTMREILQDMRRLQEGDPLSHIPYRERQGATPLAESLITPEERVRYNERDGLMKQVRDCTEQMLFKPSPELLVERAKVYAELGEELFARADLTMAIALRPANLHEAYRMRAELASSYDDALKDLNSSLRLKKTARGHYQRGCLYFEYSRFAEAEKDLTAALRRGVRDAALFIRRAASRFHTLKFAKALVDLDEFEKLVGPAARARTRSLRASALYCMGRFKEAAGIHATLDPATLPESEQIEVFFSLRRGASKAVQKRYAEQLAGTVKTSNKSQYDSVQQMTLRHVLGMKDADEKDIEFMGMQPMTSSEGHDPCKRSHAGYYIAEQRLWQGDRKEAAARFRESVRAGKADCEVRVAAAAMLRLMEAGKV